MKLKYKCQLLILPFKKINAIPFCLVSLCTYYKVFTGLFYAKNIYFAEKQELLVYRTCQ